MVDGTVGRMIEVSLQSWCLKRQGDINDDDDDGNSSKGE